MAGLETDVVLLKKEVKDMKLIHTRLDTAIVKITDVSNSIHRMLAVHEEKLNAQEEAVFAAEELIETRRSEFSNEIKELHSRITTNSKETFLYIAETERRLTTVMDDHNKRTTEEFKKLHNEISNRVGVLEKWRWLIVGGSIVLGFIIQKLPFWGS